MSTTFDLKNLGLAYGTYTIEVKAKGKHWKDSPAGQATYTRSAYVVEPNEYGETVITNEYTTEANASGTTVII